MSTSLWATVRAGLVGPLLVVAVLAVGLGYMSGRMVNANESPSRIGAVTTRGAPPSTPTPTPSPEPAQDGTSGSHGPSCPSGCQCQFPNPGAQIVICRG